VSSTTWTPRAVASKAVDCRLELWRAVEAQHVASTRRLVDSNAEQEALEDILEQTKPRARQALIAHAADIALIRYHSVRDPQPG
jgi:hypothetical protein